MTKQPNSQTMPSKQQSERSSVASNSSTSSPPSRPPPKSLIVSKVSVTKDDQWLFDDLSYNYPDVKRVFRNYDQQGNELDSIRVDFYSDGPVADILDEQSIYIENNPHYVRPFWPLVCYRCHREGHFSADCPQQPVPEWRLAELMEEQKSHFETTIKEFESRWNDRLSKLKPPANTPDMSALLPITNDVATVCQQLNQHNALLQKQLATIAHRVQSLQTTSK